MVRFLCGALVGAVAALFVAYIDYTRHVPRHLRSRP